MFGNDYAHGNVQLDSKSSNEADSIKDVNYAMTMQKIA